MTRRPAQRRCAAAFTLLEAVIAVAMLAGVIAAALDLRAQLLRSNRTVDARLAAERDADVLFHMVVTGAIDPPALADAGSIVWRGELNGAPYTVTRAAETHPNPCRGAVQYDVGPTVVVYRYDVDLAGRTTTFLWRR